MIRPAPSRVMLPPLLITKLITVQAPEAPLSAAWASIIQRCTVCAMCAVPPSCQSPTPGSDGARWCPLTPAIRAVAARAAAALPHFSAKDLTACALHTTTRRALHTAGEGVELAQ